MKGVNDAGARAELLALARHAETDLVRRYLDGQGKGAHFVEGQKAIGGLWIPGNGERIPIYFANPIDTTPVYGERGWQRSGETIDTLTLTPSIWINKSKNPPGWHGFIENGGVRNA